MLVFFSFVVCYCIVGTFLHNIMKNELQRLRLICSLGWWKCFKRLNNIITLGWFTIKRVASSWLNRAAALKNVVRAAVQRPVSAWSIFGRGNFLKIKTIPTGVYIVIGSCFRNDCFYPFSGRSLILKCFLLAPLKTETRNAICVFFFPLFMKLVSRSEFDLRHSNFGMVRGWGSWN